ncbi:hypothetical protein [Novosphingobium sp. FKTRR1]|uniref:hypothetical protein n=1 Tax=Novosphingobium sp. FKTRR1 TaxID=2879118 RepID=UPI001CEFDEEB|nr:hypothetical protein [Novosphingobium sp. FKTRR1]
MTKKNTGNDPGMSRLNALVKEHGFALKIEGDTYIFIDFTAHGLAQALAYVEGFHSGYEHAQADAFMAGLED